ncbi:MAG: hypothetical protein K6T28_03055 [Acidothermus sp.]|nr:hypothetical protein [Acidothermus sp.]
MTAPARPSTPDDPLTIVDARTPAEATTRLSELLFSASEGVVLTDLATLPFAARWAAAYRLPLLVVPPDSDPPVEELSRLGARWAVAVGSADAAGLPRRDLPPVSGQPPPYRTDVVVLVDPDAQPVATAAAAAAAAAGVPVVTVTGGDPRTDPVVVGELARLRPTHVIAIGAEFGPEPVLASRVAVAVTGRQLPGGGQVIFPGRRFVALYGHPGTAALGVLGAQDVPASVRRAQELADRYQALSDVPVIPAFEIIAAVAQRSPGADGNYTAESDPTELQPWVEAAAEAGMYVVLDLQPARADLVTLAERYESLLAFPNVGLAVDPEWALAPGQLPLQQIGSLDAAALNRLAGWLDRFTAAHRLPQKLFVVHQFRLSMIAHEDALRTHYDNIALLIHMDGQGRPADKEATWRSVVAAAPDGVPLGWKNFYREDHPMLDPQQTMAHRPAPLMISYQ